MVLMSHIRKMSEVQSIKANGVKVSVKRQSMRHLAVHCVKFFFLPCCSLP